MVIRVGVLTVSDTSSANPSLDKSGPTIKDIVSQKSAFEVDEVHCRIVPDDEEKILSVVQQACGSGAVDWLITTGGTGFGVRDVTPEAIAPLIERPAPGLVHLMLSSSLRYTPLAALSRPVAGTIGNTLVTTLPGSVKAVKENLEALFQAGVVEHAIDLIRGVSGRLVHAQLEAEGSGGPVQSADTDKQHHHHHHHHLHHGGHTIPTPRSTAALSHDPSGSVAARHRHSPFPQIPLEKALDIIKEKIERLPFQTLPVNLKLTGYILAEDVHAPQDVPSTFTTNVDGYALQSSDAPGIYKVLTAKTHPLSTSLPTGYVFRVNTGGPIPKGADAVIMVEDTELVSTSTDAHGVQEEKEIRTLAQIPKGENTRKPASDAMEGDLVLRAGDRITQRGGEVGTLAFIGRKEVKVYKKPVVAILSTGNELLDLQAPASSSSAGEWAGIYDTNRPSLQAALESMGYEVVDLGIVIDEIPAHVTALRAGLEKADLVLTTGGTSMGPTDLLKPVMERYLDGTVHFGRVSIKPGKPTTFATIPVAVASGNTNATVHKPMFALPGNPASALVTFYIFVVPALRRLGGWPERLCALPRVQVQIQNPMPLDSRVEFHRVIIKSDALSSSSNTGVLQLKAYSTGGQRSSRVASLCEANGLVVLPALTSGSEAVGKDRLESGEFAQAVLIGEIEME